MAAHGVRISGSRGGRGLGISWALAGIIATGALSTAWFAIARKGASERALAARLDQQATALGVLSDKMDQLERSFGEAARSMAGASRPSPVAVLSQEQIERVSSEVAAKTAPPAPPPATSDNLAAREAGDKLVDQAIRAQRWTESDARDLRLLLARVSPEDRMVLARRISAAINDHEMVPTFHGPIM